MAQRDALGAPLPEVAVDECCGGVEDIRQLSGWCLHGRPSRFYGSRPNPVRLLHQLIHHGEILGRWESLPEMGAVSLRWQQGAVHGVGLVCGIADATVKLKVGQTQLGLDLGNVAVEVGDERG